MQAHSFTTLGVTFVACAGVRHLAQQALCNLGRPVARVTSVKPTPCLGARVAPSVGMRGLEGGQGDLTSFSNSVQLQHDGHKFEKVDPGSDSAGRSK